MRIIRNFIFLFIAAAISTTALLAKPIPGPKGGKIVTTEAPHVELFVAPDRTVVVSFFDNDLKPVAPAGHVVSAVAEAKTGKVNMLFAAKDGALVSSTPLPQGDGYRVVVQVRATAAAKPQNFRLDLNLATCGECSRAEYACICEGH